MGKDKHERRFDEIAELQALIEGVKSTDDLVRLIREHKIDLEMVLRGLRKEAYAMKDLLELLNKTPF